MTANTKRAYTAPIIDSVRIDREMSLVMMSPPVGPGENAPLYQQPDNKSIEKSPFGGDKPDYGKM